MSPQEEIFTLVKEAIESSTDLNTLIGSTPNTFANYAEEATACPYFIYKLNRMGNEGTGIGEGKLKISIWFYSTNSADIYTAEDIIVWLFDRKTLNSDTVKACRIWHVAEERKESIKKDYIKDRDAINIEIIFYLRWINVPRIVALGGS